jgi:DNA polymerase delta subunit 4
MPPKRIASGPKAKSHQSTLAFHGTSNKVTKSGNRAQIAKKNLIDEPVTKTSTPEVADVSVTEEAEPSTAEAAIIEQTEQELVAQQAKSTPEEDEARKLSEARIKKYWTDKEKKRAAPRVHQEDLTVHEKILREFDMSGQYGVSNCNPTNMPAFGVACLQIATSVVLTSNIALHWHRPFETVEACSQIEAQPADRGARGASERARRE